ncbi:MAG: HlyD family secretion protein [Micavibrio aeruginosavorus]|uniref:HlyD family secretion protein n=1 Tax=Micavibrio aeruginosavorus TaxID=349221 RepID=A0A2W5PNK0_9BACT|nr:MAG: HlyD family secretion protein [Micavibrio aeruginosavorus]
MSKKSGKSLVLVLVILVALGGGFAYWLSTRGLEETDDAAIEAHIIPIAPKVSGYVVEINIDDNTHVKKGDILLKIDQRDYIAALDRATAELSAAEARLIAGQHNFASTSVSAPSNLTSAQSQVASAAADLKNAQQTLKRLQTLNDAARSRQSLEDAQAEEKRARSALEDAKAKLRSAETAPDAIAASEASVKELEAAVLQAKASVQLAQNNLDDTIIRAAQDGRITRKNVEVGAFVQPGQQLTTLVGDDIWVIANFKETQLDGMKKGQSVDIKIDAYPNISFSGKVDSIQSGTGARFSLFPPENATGNFVKIVQRVPVKIIFDQSPGEKYPTGPGMSVIPTVNLK